MHFMIPLFVFITANIWGIYSSIPFTNINPSRSFLDRALGGVQLASTVYTFEQIPGLINAEATTRHIMGEIYGVCNATMVSETGSMVTIHAGPRPSAAPLTVSSAMPPRPPSQTPRSVHPPLPEVPLDPFLDSLVPIMLFIILAAVAVLMLKQYDQAGGLAALVNEIHHSQVVQNNIWLATYNIAEQLQRVHEDSLSIHQSLHRLEEIASRLQAPSRVESAREQAACEQPHDNGGSGTSPDGSNSDMDHILHDVMNGIDTLRQCIDRNTEMWDGFSERVVVCHVATQDTQPSDSSVNDSNGSPAGGCVQTG
ncbi:uncharacterized protein N7482_000626 [Penicillium canariense]|uniref:Uncharacterized protein n=1 Tax=Penicillium canariense TaxID=189055 RepID=A0A9W9IEH7_9EURO|nr:uncharacterized protein N7482_000626 [Penicillium canariense]KAJ5174749.1 hypothetical protein N7482_000626 [Penicillium canariense]